MKSPAHVAGFFIYLLSCDGEGVCRRAIFASETGNESFTKTKTKNMKKLSNTETASINGGGLQMN